jgi:hypothetical protein
LAWVVAPIAIEAGDEGGGMTIAAPGGWRAQPTKAARLTGQPFCQIRLAARLADVVQVFGPILASTPGGGVVSATMRALVVLLVAAAAVLAAAAPADAAIIRARTAEGAVKRLLARNDYGPPRRVDCARVTRRRWSCDWDAPLVGDFP